MRIAQFILGFFFLVLSSCGNQLPTSTSQSAIDDNHLSNDTERISEIAELPKGLNESSGMVRTESGTLLSHNDSGGESKLFEFTMKGELVRKIEIEDAKNRDWEDITSDSNYVYIGDMGNNSGNRKNLMIYQVSKKQIAEKKTPIAHKIKFSYPEQKEFGQSRKHNFDCEAILAWNNHIYLFTKNRGDKKCSLYKIPAIPGEYEAQLISTFDTKGLITGADINPSKNQICLVGYNYVGLNGFEPFFWTFTNFKGDNFFSGASKRKDITMNRQTEAVCYFNDESILFTEEEENVTKSYLYEMKVF